MKDDNYSPQGSKIYKKDGSIGYLEDLFKNIIVDQLSNLIVNGNDVSALNPVNVDTKDVSDAMMGNLGGVYSGAATITPAATYIFNAIQIVTNAVLTCTGAPTGITAIAFESGTTIYGRFSQVVIASGSVIAYQGK